MIDKVFKKQLEKFGIEQFTVAEEEVLPKKPIVFSESGQNVVRGLMNTMEGREWLYNKLEFYCVNSTPFIPNHPEVTAFLCGLQEAGHQLQNEIMQVAPNEYFVMIQEAAARLQNIPVEKKEEES